jgi:hypothetical protein
MTECKYLEGFNRGRSWTAKYRPGGPWVMYPRPSDDDEFKAHCKRTLDDHDAWLEGFDDGRDAAKYENE